MGFTTKTVTISSTATQEFCFDSDGFELRRRILAGPNRSTNDLLIVRTPDSQGFAVSEKLYGGDDQNLTDQIYNSLCDMTLPATPRYELAHTYQSGVRASTTRLNPCDGTTVVTQLDTTIDASTGLIASSRDAAGVQTTFTYDTSGRIRSQRPQQSAWLVWQYQLPSVASPNRASHLTVFHCLKGSANCSTGAALSWKRTDFDRLGRGTSERIRIPTDAGITEQTRTTIYNARGWTQSQSSWLDASHLTVFEQYDPFGRPGRITPPGQSPLDYHGPGAKRQGGPVALTGGQRGTFGVDRVEGVVFGEARNPVGR